MKRKEKIIRFFLAILLISLCQGQVALGQSTDVAQQPKAVVLRNFNTEKLEQYRSDSRYRYSPVAKRERGALGKLLLQIENWFGRMLGSATAATWWKILWRLVLIAAFILFLLKIFGIEANAIFSPDTGKKRTQEIGEEELEVDFEQEIQKAIQSKQWRRGIRLIYLYALKHLADSGQIEVKKGKTNRDYLYGLSSGELRQNFSQLSFLFDYTWYGHFDASRAMADKALHYLNAIRWGKGEIR